MNLTLEQEEISSSSENPYSKKNAIGLGKKWFSWFYKRSSGGVLASLIFLGVAGGSSMSLESQGFLFAADSTAGGSYVEEVYVDALVDNYNLQDSTHGELGLHAEYIPNDRIMLNGKPVKIYKEKDASKKAAKEWVKHQVEVRKK